MSRPSDLLPSFGTTGIGSLPHTQLELGLQMALQVDIPFCPQLPIGHPTELMIAETLEGLPGLSVDGEGSCTVDLAAWEVSRAAFGTSVEGALSSGDLSRWEPSPEACRAWRPFLWEVEHRKMGLAKAQLAGPATVRWVARTSAGQSAADVAALDQQIFRLVLARFLARAGAIRRAGATPVIFIDEPGLYALDRQDVRHVVVLQELKVLVMALQRAGAIVGLHCCSNTDWPALMELGLDLLSVDARLSLDALLDDATAVHRYLAEGGRLSLGVIPTDVSSTYEVEVLTDSIDASLRSALGGRYESVASRCLLTPACGLAMRSVLDAERIFQQLRDAQRALRTFAEAA